MESISARQTAWNDPLVLPGRILVLLGDFSTIPGRAVFQAAAVGKRRDVRNARPEGDARNGCSMTVLYCRDMNQYGFANNEASDTTSGR
jgi:hypothetical protein